MTPFEFGQTLGKQANVGAALGQAVLPHLAYPAIGAGLGAATAPAGHRLEGLGRGAGRGLGTSVGMTAGGLGGGLAGAGTGAAIGSLIAPGPGTAIGGLVGGAAGLLGGTAYGGVKGYQTAGKMMGPASYAKPVAPVAATTK